VISVIVIDLVPDFVSFCAKQNARSILFLWVKEYGSEAIGRSAPFYSFLQKKLRSNTNNCDLYHKGGLMPALQAAI
jgi:hypothetical protein